MIITTNKNKFGSLGYSSYICLLNLTMQTFTAIVDRNNAIGNEKVAQWVPLLGVG
jgi:hypothetical protein